MGDFIFYIDSDNFSLYHFRNSYTTQRSVEEVKKKYSNIKHKGILKNCSFVETYTLDRVIPIMGANVRGLSQFFLLRGDIISWVTSFVALQCKVIHYFVQHSMGI